MNYIYDIVLNFQNEYYDFFEWNKSDKIIHIKKIPVFKIKENTYLALKKNTCKLDHDFTNSIKNKTITYKNKTLSHVCIICCHKETMAIKINSDGLIIGKSSLIIEENDDIVSWSNRLEFTNLTYKIINNKIFKFHTRKENENILFIENELDKLIKEKNIEKLTFLYLECFNKIENDINKITSFLKLEIQNNSNNCNKIYNFFKLTKSH